MKTDNMVTPRLGFVYTLEDILQTLRLYARPRLTVYYPDSIEHGKVGDTVLRTSHLTREELLTIKNIACSNWRYKMLDGDVPVFEFVHGSGDIHRYFNFLKLINEDGDEEEGKLWATPVGWHIAQPFEARRTATLYATQGGGTAIRDEDGYVFVDVPSFGDYKRGDAVPNEWGVAPCGTFRWLTGAEMDTAFNQGYSAGMEGEPYLAPFENFEADKQWCTGHRYGAQDRRIQSALIAYSD